MDEGNAMGIVFFPTGCLRLLGATMTGRGDWIYILFLGSRSGMDMAIEGMRRVILVRSLSWLMFVGAPLLLAMLLLLQPVLLPWTMFGGSCIAY